MEDLELQDLEKVELVEVVLRAQDQFLLTKLRDQVGSYIANSFIGPTAPSYGTAYSPGGLSSSRFFAGGGGGATTSTCTAKRGSGGDGGGGRGAVDGAAPVKVGCNGTVNTGGGGGGGGPATSTGGTGGSGIVMIRYKFQN